LRLLRTAASIAVGLVGAVEPPGGALGAGEGHMGDVQDDGRDAQQQAGAKISSPPIAADLS
jgi:hypothetical protein